MTATRTPRRRFVTGSALNPSTGPTASAALADDDAVAYATGERLRWWSSLWRYAVVIVSAVVIFIFNTAVLVSTPEIEHVDSWRAALPLADLLLGSAAIALLPLRRRYPEGIATIVVLLTGFSPTAGAAATLAVVSLATHRRAIPIIAVCVLGVVAPTLYEISLPRDAWTIPGHLWATPVAWAVGYVLTVLVGLYIGARRELVRSLHERALEAERERELAARAAQAGERTRIAREMHDVLAHRISLVAMHAGALTYRDDLGREETREAARLIQSNARRALTELRGVLGVLRGGEVGAGEGGVAVEPPQPTLVALPSLVAEAGPGVTFEGAEAEAFASVPSVVSRTAYRVVQEALTNARKHASGSSVRVRVDGSEGGLLTVEVVNSAPPLRTRSIVPGAGAGLAGLAERVGLAEGTLEHGPTPAGGYAVRALLPWEADEAEDESGEAP